MIPFIAFDAAGTLFEPAEPVENTYADCFSTLGFGLPESTWKTAFERSFLITPEPEYTSAKDGDTVEKEWWRDIVRNAAEATGIRPDPHTMANAFEELFDHYASGNAWKLFPETDSVLSALKANGTGLAVVSNFDSRLHRVLKELGIREQFDFVLTSADVLARKPLPSIIHSFIEKSGAAPADCCLTGDSLVIDGGASEGGGIAFFHIDRPSVTLTDFLNWHCDRFFSK